MKVTPEQKAYFGNLPQQTAPGVIRNKDRNRPCFCGSGIKCKRCCAWKTVANYVIYNGGEWQKKVNIEGNRQIELAGMPLSIH